MLSVTFTSYCFRYQNIYKVKLSWIKAVTVFDQILTKELCGICLFRPVVPSMHIIHIHFTKCWAHCLCTPSSLKKKKLFYHDQIKLDYIVLLRLDLGKVELYLSVSNISRVFSVSEKMSTFSSLETLTRKWCWQGSDHETQHNNT